MVAPVDNQRLLASTVRRLQQVAPHFRVIQQGRPVTTNEECLPLNGLDLPVDANLWKAWCSRLAVLELLVGVQLVNSLTRDALLLHFLERSRPKGAGRVLRINPPWKLSFGKVVVGESQVFDGRGKGGRERRDRWSLGFAGWLPGALTGVSVGMSVPDLWLAFKSGHVLETFLGPANGSSWSLTGPDNQCLVSSADFRDFQWR